MRNQQEAFGAFLAVFGRDEVRGSAGSGHIDPFNLETQRFQFGAHHLTDGAHAFEIHCARILVDQFLEQRNRPLIFGVDSCNHFGLGLVQLRSCRG